MTPFTLYVLSLRYIHYRLAHARRQTGRDMMEVFLFIVISFLLCAVAVLDTMMPGSVTR